MGSGEERVDGEEKVRVESHFGDRFHAPVNAPRWMLLIIFTRALRSFSYSSAFISLLFICICRTCTTLVPLLLTGLRPVIVKREKRKRGELLLKRQLTSKDLAVFLPASPSCDHGETVPPSWCITRRSASASGLGSNCTRVFLSCTKEAKATTWWCCGSYSHGHVWFVLPFPFYC